MSAKYMSKKMEMITGYHRAGGRHKEFKHKPIMNSMHFKVVLEKDEEAGGYVVTCPSLPGCASQGDTIKEALENIKEAIQACLESLAEDELGQYLTKPSTRIVEVVA